MIRVNLLPRKRRPEGGASGAGSQTWLLFVFGAVLLEAVGLLWFHGSKTQELKVQRSTNQELQNQIDEAQKSTANHAEVKQKLELLRAREAAIDKLQSARTGPTAVLLELARILTPGRGPSVAPDELRRMREENPLAVFNASWDPRRMWLTRFVEQQRTVRIDGTARDGEDVSELARRMSLSSYFFDVRLLPAKKTNDTQNGFNPVAFQLEAQVRY